MSANAEVFSAKTFTPGRPERDAGVSFFLESTGPLAFSYRVLADRRVPATYKHFEAPDAEKATHFKTRPTATSPCANFGRFETQGMEDTNSSTGANSGSRNSELAYPSLEHLSVQPMVRHGISQSFAGAIMSLTHRQLLHREYLKSPIWQAKRMEALTHYGCICSRCGEHGTDVHHRTYKRTGGWELMADLEVLCRSCHETHHRVERVMKRRTSTKKGRRRRGRSIHVRALVNYLTPTQRTKLMERFNLTFNGVYAAIVIDKREDVTDAALLMLGKTHSYSSTYKPDVRSVQRIQQKSQVSHYLKTIA